MLTLEEITEQYHVSKRTLESNLVKLKPLYEGSKLINTGQKWLVDKSVIKELTARKYAKHYIQHDNGIKVDDIDLKKLVRERELKTFITIAPKGVKSLQKMKDIVRDLFEYYHEKHSQEYPTFFIYSIEDNTDYLNEKQNKGYHIHIVTNANYSYEQQQELTQLLQEQIDPNRVHDKYTVSVAPYIVGLGMGALNYTLKMATHTGAYIK